ncbi:hypothetical protein R3W88_030490 [Solanum pinnatisectum]|uniref:Uncharacterized protein n=1 Tax=Solanum pinnatisectum TaxID=50273 RepID=A0AAV9KAM4_9SOLN|nr:hypothetical protein R3W88_030490 [Solanum pinnatisectum]
MNSNGKFLFSIRNGVKTVFGHWDGYKWSYDGVASKEIPWFQVQKTHNVRNGDKLTMYSSPSVTYKLPASTNHFNSYSYLHYWVNLFYLTQEV